MRVAGEVRGFDAAALVEERFLVQTDRFTHFAMAAADLALADSGLRADDDSPFDIGVVTAAGSGGGEFGQRELQRLWGQGPRYVGPYQSIAWFYAASTGQISIRGGFKGPAVWWRATRPAAWTPSRTPRRNIRRGTDAVVVGAAEAPLAPYSVGLPARLRRAEPGHRPGRRLPAVHRQRLRLRARGGRRDAGGRGRAGTPAARRADPGRRRRPRGHLHRRLPVGGVPRGAGPGDPRRAGRGRAARRRTSTWSSPTRWAPWTADRAEALALADALGRHASRVPVTAPKTGTGRAYCGAPLLDTAAAVLAMEHGVVPPTPYVTDICHDLDLVTGRARPARAAHRAGAQPRPAWAPTPALRPDRPVLADAPEPSERNPS